MKEQLIKECNTLLYQLTELINKLEPYKHEQFVLDFCDSVNELSVKY